MQSNLPHRYTNLSIFAALSIVAGGAGCGPNISLMASTGMGDDPCVTLAEETIALSRQLLDNETATGQIDNDLACRILANEIQLVDDGCIAESDLPDGVDRDSLVLQQEQEFNCLQQPDAPATQ